MYKKYICVYFYCLCELYYNYFIFIINDIFITVFLYEGLKPVKEDKLLQTGLPSCLGIKSE